MPTELHDLSVAIGELGAATAHAGRSREATHQRIEDIGRWLDTHGHQMEELPMSVRPDPTAMKPEIQHHAAARRRVPGGAAVPMALAGAAGGPVG